ncbi:MAG: PQQ-binding-like beta-propeller repeat protein [Phycisphaera sp.]|nr:PQQ-binding-like beta-propeller repeat protein [Phycisphaera sp.]
MRQRHAATTLSRTAFAMLALVALFTTVGCDDKPSTRASAAPQPDAAPVATSKPVSVSSDVKPGSAPAISVGANDWPWWRGPSKDGIAPASATPVTEWSETSNIVWKTDVPGRGHASPIVVGDRVIIATCDEAAGTESLLCYDRNDGKQAWATQLHQGELPAKNRKNSHASLTPACDGQQVYTIFVIDDALWVDAVTLDGAVVWKKRIDDYKSEHGHGASPILYKSTVIISGEDLTGGYLAALDRATGDVIWKTPRTRSDVHANYATPNVGRVAGRDQLVIHGYDRVTSYDPATGKELWHADGPTEVCANTPLFSDTHVYVSGGFPRKKLMAIRADGSGDVTKTHVEWTDGAGVAYVPSSLLHNDRLYVVNDGGIVSCYNATTGKDIWRQRLGRSFTASLELVGDRLYISGESGTTYVFKAADTFEMIAENQLPGGQLATPAFSGDAIFLRTDTSLYRIGPKAAE